MTALTIGLWMLARLGLVYALGLFMLVVGARHTYWAWTGQTDELTTVIEGPLAEDPQSRRLLWLVGGPLVVAASLALTGVITWLLVGQ